jgi:hypothetical protein
MDLTVVQWGGGRGRTYNYILLITLVTRKPSSLDSYLILTFFNSCIQIFENFNYL